MKMNASPHSHYGERLIGNQVLKGLRSAAQISCCLGYRIKRRLNRRGRTRTREILSNFGRDRLREFRDKNVVDSH